MSWQRKAFGSTLAFIGYLLSPLSPWNDLFVNVPLAVGFAWVVSAFWPAAFQVSLIVGYWLTNLLGFVLLHCGARQLLGDARAYSGRALLKDAAIALAYTAVLAALVWLGILKPVQDYGLGR